MQVTVGSSVEQIDNGAFYCQNLREVINLSSLNIRINTENGQIGQFAWSITSNTDNAKVKIDETSKFVNYNYHDSEDNTDEIRAFLYYGDDEDVTVPNDVTQLTRTFVDNETIKSVTLGNNVKRINRGAFYNCQNLTSISIQSGVKYLDCYAFERLNKITDIYLPNTIEECNEHVFDNCSSLTTIHYNGTKAEFAAIKKVDRYHGTNYGSMTYEYLMGNYQEGTIIQCTDGVIPMDD